MKFAYMNDKLVRANYKKQLLENCNTPEEVKQRLYNLYKKTDFSVKDLNNVLKNQTPPWPTIKEFSQEEIQQRQKLSEAMHQKMINILIPHILYSPTVEYKDGMDNRYWNKFLLKHSPEAGKENEQKIEILNNPEKNFSKFLDMHLEMYGDADKVKELFHKNLSDQELLDNVEIMSNAEIKATVIQNVNRNIEIMLQREKDDANSNKPENEKFKITDEQKEKLKKLNQQLNSYQEVGTLFNAKSERIGIISNPLYAVLDPDEQSVKWLNDEFINSHSEVVNELSSTDLLDEENEITNRPLLEDMVLGMHASELPYIKNEIGSMKELLTRNSNDKFVMKINGSDQEFAVTDDLYVANEVYCNPGIKFTITNKSTGEYLESKDAFNRFYENMLSKVNGPDPIKEPDPLPPVNKPEVVKEPGFFAKFLHTISFGRLYKKTFDDYNNYVKDQKAYDEYQEKEADNKRIYDVAKKRKELLSPEEKLENVVDVSEKTADAKTFVKSYTDKAYETINNPNSSEADMNKAMATLVISHNLLIDPNQTSVNSKNFEHEVDSLAKMNEFIKVINSKADIRKNFSNEANTMKNIANLLNEVVTPKQPANVDRSNVQVKESHKEKEVTAAAKPVNVK